MQIHRHAQIQSQASKYIINKYYEVTWWPQGKKTWGREWLDPTPTYKLNINRVSHWAGFESMNRVRSDSTS